jgi:hypothetical protein
MGLVIVLVIAYMTLFLLRLVSGRLAMRPSRRAWLLVGPRFLTPVVMLIAAALIAPKEPIVGLFVAIMGLAFGGLVVWMGRALARASASATTPEELANAAVEPTAEFMLSSTILSLLGLLVIGLLAIVWAVLAGGR